LENSNKNRQFIKTYLSRHIHGLGSAALALLGLAISPAALAQSYTLTTLVSFSSKYVVAPNGGLVVNGGNVYGTTEAGGTYSDGTVFSVPTTGGTPTTLATFNGTNGHEPRAGLILSGSTLYGITEAGGPAFEGGLGGFGTVFSVPITGGNPTVLTSFNGTNGAGLIGGLTLSGNTLYGTTFEGPTNIPQNGNGDGYGTVFSVPTTGGTPTTIASFNGTNGDLPETSLVLSGSTLYGTTNSGGPTYSDSANSIGDGTVFSVPITGGDPTVLASFNGTNGNGPFGNLTLIGSTLYGTTNSGGANGDGTVFSVPTTGGAPTVLASFSGGNGIGPFGGLTLFGSTLFGTTQLGGAYGDGTVFSVPITGGMPTVLVNFNGNNGSGPNGSLTLSGSTLYGATEGGGAYGNGTVFSLTPDPTPVPEASSVVSMGLMLALGLGGMVIASKRVRTHEKGQR